MAGEFRLSGNRGDTVFETSTDRHATLSLPFSVDDDRRIAVKKRLGLGHAWLECLLSSSLVHMAWHNSLYRVNVDEGRLRGIYLACPLSIKWALPRLYRLGHVRDVAS